MIKELLIPSIALKEFESKFSEAKYRRIYFIHLISLLGMFSFAISIPLGFILHTPLAMAISNFIGLLLTLSTLFFLHRQHKEELAANSLLLILVTSTLFTLYISQNQNLTLIITLFFPLVAIFLKGEKEGFYLSLIYIFLTLAYAYWGIENFDTPLDTGSFTTYTLISFINLTLVLFYEKGRSATERSLQAANIELLSYKNDLEKKVRLALEESLEREQMLIQQSKMAQTGDMIGSISHQWKQPLSSCMAIVSNLQLDNVMETSSKEDMDTSLLNIVKQLNYMEQTISDFTNFFKPSSQKEHFSIEKSIQSLQSIIKPQLQENSITFTALIESKELTLFGKRNEFLQVLLNIINNAKDAFKERHIQGEIIMRVQSDEKSIIIEIQDSAGGIPLDIIDNIFNPYFTTKEHSNGTGIGLHMAQTILEQHLNGSIKVSNTTEGACFSLIFKKASV